LFFVIGAKWQDSDLKSSLRDSPEHKSPGTVGSDALLYAINVAYQFNVSLGNRLSLSVENESRYGAARKDRDLTLLTFGRNGEERNKKGGKKPPSVHPLSFHGRPPNSSLVITQNSCGLVKKKPARHGFSWPVSRETFNYLV
jgi:hypothetical protein